MMMADARLWTHDTLPARIAAALPRAARRVFAKAAIASDESEAARLGWIAVRKDGWTRDPKTSAWINKEHLRTLYVSRPLLNHAEVIEWARSQGIPNLIAGGDMHVTIAFSRGLVDWDKLGEDGADDLGAEGGPRRVAKLGPMNDVLALKFTSFRLEWRHEDLEYSGATWDWPEYLPHITLAESGGADFDVDAVEPFIGPLRFGAERYEEVKESLKNLPKVQWIVKWTGRAVPSVVEARTEREARIIAEGRARAAYGRISSARRA